MGNRPELRIRNANGTWDLMFAQTPRRWWRALFNPGGNLRHANQNLTQRLLEESMHAPDVVADLTSYRLVEHIARSRGARQFKLIANGEDVLLSPEFSS